MNRSDRNCEYRIHRETIESEICYIDLYVTIENIIMYIRTCVHTCKENKRNFLHIQLHMHNQLGFAAT